MTGIGRSTRKTVHTAVEAVDAAADAVRSARAAVRTAKKAGAEATTVAKKVANRVTGRDAKRRKQAAMVVAGDEKEIRLEHLPDDFIDDLVNLEGDASEKSASTNFVSLK